MCNKVPGYEGHHINSVQAMPELAGEADNIRFENRSEHFQSHGSNWRNPTNGELLNRSGGPRNRSNPAAESAIDGVGRALRTAISEEE
ncbi:hypothetical protein ACPPVV_01030 [Rhodanobacter sp. Col0626]|uniref:hypothetical protein n=1 Tax=Rhodanobacter sp. Col0626 TaxID=3415679 RepID=UPI003CE6AD59